MGAREAGSTSVALGAFGRRDEVLKRTEHNKPHKHNDVWWYRTDNYSFGFAPSPDVSQYRADSLYPRDERRLSWHLQGDGGWRAGGVCDLNGETPWRKLILYGIEPDRFTAKEVGAVDVYMGDADDEQYDARAAGGGLGGVSGGGSGGSGGGRGGGWGGAASAGLNGTSSAARSLSGQAEMATGGGGALGGLVGQAARRARMLDKLKQRASVGAKARMVMHKAASLSGLAVSVQAFSNALTSKKESPKYGLLKAVSATLQSAPQLYLCGLVVALEGYGSVRSAEPILVASAFVSLAALCVSLTGLLCSEATSSGLRVRDEYVRSAQVYVLVALYFLSDALLRGLAAACLGYALGDHLLTACLYTLGFCLLSELLRIGRRAGCGAMCAVIFDLGRTIEVSVRALLPLIAPVVLQPRTPPQRRWGFVASTGLSAGLTLLALSDYVPKAPVDPELRLQIYTLLCCALVAKYLAFAWCVLPAMSERSYGVLGVGLATRERGRLACLAHGEGAGVPPPRCHRRRRRPAPPASSPVSAKRCTRCSSCSPAGLRPPRRRGLLSSGGVVFDPDEAAPYSELREDEDEGRADLLSA